MMQLAWKRQEGEEQDYYQKVKRISTEITATRGMD